MRRGEAAELFEQFVARFAAVEHAGVGYALRQGRWPGLPIVQLQAHQQGAAAAAVQLPGFELRECFWGRVLYADPLAAWHQRFTQLRIAGQVEVQGQPLAALAPAPQAQRQGRTRLSLDLKLPGYSALREALMPSSERLGVNDAAPEQLPQIERSQDNVQHEGALLVGLELDDQRPWPPALPASVKNAGVLDSRESRRRLLDQLSHFPPARLAVACDPRRSPDRGSLALLAELARSAAATRIWLMQPPPGQALDAERLGDWHQALEQLALPYADTAPMNWLEHGHD